MAQYIKIGGVWKPIVGVYKKVNGSWVEQEVYAFENTVYLYNSSKIDVDVLYIIADDSYTGKQAYLIAKFNSTRVYPTWSITSGEQYATINSNGKLDIESGASNNYVTVQASYENLIVSKTISVSYDNQLVIESPDVITGTTGNVIAIYNSTVVSPGWTIISGSQHATIDSNGAITIISSGTIRVRASYGDYITMKDIRVEYDATKSQQTVVDETGTITTTETTTTTDPITGTTTVESIESVTYEDGSTANTTSTTTTNLDGSTTTTSETTNSDGSSVSRVTSTSAEDSDGSYTVEESTEVTNADGTSSESSSTTVNHEDGSSSSSSSLIMYDENGNVIDTTETTSTTSAPDQDGTVTTQSTTEVTNTDGTSSESSSTLVERTDGSSTSSTQSTNYDANGDPTGSISNTTNIYADGSSLSQTTNYDENGDPTTGTNLMGDTAGNVDIQNLEYDSNGDPTVTGYTIDTSGSDGAGKDINADGVNTDYYAFDITYGFELNIHFTINYSQQPANQNENHHNILNAKRANPSPWYGFQLRQSSTNKYIQLGVQMNSGSNANTTINGQSTGVTNEGEFDLTITYNPLASTNKFVCYNNLTESVVYSKNDTFPDIEALKYLKITIGYAVDANGDPYRYSNINLKNFSVSRIYPTWNSSESWDTSSQWIS